MTPLADFFANKSLTVLPKQNTVIYKLLGYIEQLEPALFPSPESLAEYLELLTTSETNLFTNELDSVVGVLKQSVSAHLSFAKNIVKPLVVDYVKLVQEYLATTDTETPMSKFNIDVVTEPTLFNDVSFMDSISFYKSKSVLIPDDVIGLGPRSGRDILDLMLTRDQDTDQQIIAWYTVIGEDFFVQLWNGLFTKNLDSNTTFEKVRTANVADKANYALAIYLISRNIVNGADGDTPVINLAGMTKLAEQYKDFAGSLIMEAKAKFETLLKSKIMILGMGSDGYTASVYAPVYVEWLGNGGSPELIFSMISINSPQITVKDITEQTESLKKNWTSYCAYHSAAKANNSLNYFKTGMAISFSTLLKTLSETELEYINTDVDYNGKVTTLFNQQIEDLKLSDVNNIFDTCLRVICRSRFFYTDAEKILVGINRAAEANPGIDPREAALISTIEYIADFLADQMYLESKM
jgi:hypothetical protein